MWLLDLPVEFGNDEHTGPCVRHLESFIEIDMYVGQARKMSLTERQRHRCFL